MTKEEQSRVDKYYADLKEYNNLWYNKIERTLNISFFVSAIGFFVVPAIVLIIPIGFLGFNKSIGSDIFTYNTILVVIVWVLSFSGIFLLHLLFSEPKEPAKPQRQIVRYEEVTEYVSVWIEDTYHFGPRGGKYKVQDNGRGRVYVGDHVQSSGYWTSEPRTYNKKIVEFENLIN